jgi:cytochrome c-type biogenesis protein CcmH/NrfG
MLAPACFMLGRAYEEQGRVADARRCYERVLHIYSDADPDLPVLMETKERMAHITATGNM